MIKNYEEWFPKKIICNDRETRPTFREGEIWWCHIELNIGSEIIGKGRNFTRPVLIFKKWGNLFLGIPLTSSAPRRNQHFSIGRIRGRNSTALVDQLRTFDAKRLGNKLTDMKRADFEKLKTDLKILL